jgi:protein-tyrosine phosphatase
MAEIPTIDGAINFRDLGGIRASEGLRPRKGPLFRSGTLHALSDKGLAGLEALGVRVIYDLRSDGERAGRPPRLPLDGAIEHLFHAHERRTGDLFGALRDTESASASGRDIMVRVYRRLPYDFATPYRALFGHILEGRTPLVFNCAAGKDRAGLAAALILAALGASREDIQRDYLRGEEAFESILDMFVTGPRGPSVANIDPEIWRPIVRTDPLYLDTAFAEIKARSGSIDAYPRDDLGVGDHERRELRSRLLEQDSSA